MNLEQRVDFHNRLASMMEDQTLSSGQQLFLEELRSAIRDMCRCWPCATHRHVPAIYLECEFCEVCAQHAHSLDVYGSSTYSGKR